MLGLQVWYSELVPYHLSDWVHLLAALSLRGGLTVFMSVLTLAVVSR